MAVVAGGVTIADMTVSGSGDHTFTGGTITADPAAVLAGSGFTGTGRLTKTGSGTATFQNRGVFLGGVFVDGGRLVASRLDTFGSAPINVGADGTFVFSGVAGSIVNPLAGAGTIELANSTLTLDRANSFGALRLAGTAAVVTHPYALGGGNVVVDANSILRLAVGGVQAGTLTVEGGTLSFDVGSPTPAAGRAQAAAYAWGSLGLSGKLTFANQADVALNGVLTSGVYTLATTGAAITGTPAYDAHQNGMIVNLDTSGHDLLLRVYDQSINPGRSVAAAFDSMTSSLDAVRARLGESFLAPVAERPGLLNSFWVKNTASWGDREATSRDIGYSDRLLNATVGYDRAIGPSSLVGAFTGAAESHVSTSSGARTDSDLQYLGLYGTNRFGRYYVSTDFVAGQLQANVTRREPTGRVAGDFRGDFYGAGAEAGLLLTHGENLSLRPAVALHYMAVGQDSYREQGSGAVTIGDFRQGILQSLVSLNGSYRLTTPCNRPAALDASIGWRQNFGDRGTGVDLAFVNNPGAVFSTIAAANARESFVLGLGGRVEIKPGVSAGLGYQYELNAERDRHSANASVRWAF